MQQFACCRGEDADGEVGDAAQLFGLGDERERDLPGVRGRGGVACRFDDPLQGFVGYGARRQRAVRAPRAGSAPKPAPVPGRRPVSTVCTRAAGSRCGSPNRWDTRRRSAPQPIQRSVRTASIPFPSVLRTMIPAGHTCTHFPQAMQLLFSIRRVITSMSAEGFVGGDGLSERASRRRPTGHSAQRRRSQYSVASCSNAATGRRWPDARS